MAVGSWPYPFPYPFPPVRLAVNAVAADGCSNATPHDQPAPTAVLAPRQRRRHSAACGELAVVRWQLSRVAGLKAGSGASLDNGLPGSYSSPSHRTTRRGPCSRSTPARCLCRGRCPQSLPADSCPRRRIPTLTQVAGSGTGTGTETPDITLFRMNPALNVNLPYPHTPTLPYSLTGWAVGRVVGWAQSNSSPIATFRVG